MDMKKFVVAAALFFSGLAFAQTTLAGEAIKAMASSLGLVLTEAEKNNPQTILDIMLQINVIEGSTHLRMSLDLANNRLSKNDLCRFMADAIRGTNDKDQAAVVNSVAGARTFLSENGISGVCSESNTASEPANVEDVLGVFSSPEVGAAVNNRHNRASRR
jgi:hypothetical protein